MSYNPDWIAAPARARPDRLLIFTLISLLIVHAINPLGMQRHRRVNANNIDLNRTFLWDLDEVRHFRNPGYSLTISPMDLHAFCKIGEYP